MQGDLIVISWRSFTVGFEHKFGTSITPCAPVVAFREEVGDSKLVRSTSWNHLSESRKWILALYCYLNIAINMPLAVFNYSINPNN